MRNLSNVRVVSNGVGVLTVVTVDGRTIDGVIGLTWSLESPEHVGVLTLRIEGAEIEARALRVQIDGPEGA